MTDTNRLEQYGFNDAVNETASTGTVTSATFTINDDSIGTTPGNGGVYFIHGSSSINAENNTLFKVEFLNASSSVINSRYVTASSHTTSYRGGSKSSEPYVACNYWQGHGNLNYTTNLNGEKNNFYFVLTVNPTLDNTEPWGYAYLSGQYMHQETSSYPVLAFPDAQVWQENGGQKLQKIRFSFTTGSLADYTFRFYQLGARDA